MYDRELVQEVVNQILIAIDRIERRIQKISTPNDFLSSELGIDMLDSIAMMLITIGENCKNLDKMTKGSLMSQFNEVDWKGVKGMRDIISHHYFDINAEIVFFTCKKKIPPLKEILEKIKRKI